jgi:hypothetical protein
VHVVVIGVFTMGSRIALRLFGDPSTLSLKFPLAGDQGDALVHLLMIDVIRRNGHRIPKWVPQFLTGSNFDYPALYHWILSFVSARRLERFEWVLSPFIEGIHAALIYLALWLTVILD